MEKLNLIGRLAVVLLLRPAEARETGDDKESYCLLEVRVFAVTGDQYKTYFKLDI